MKNAMSKRVIALVMIGTMMGTTAVQAAEVKKDESVYVNLDTDGSFNKATVSDWIHSDESGSTVYDKSELSNIKNVKSDLKPNKNGDDLIWDMDSSDLYYQGNTNKDIPLNVSVKYYYEDEEINPEDLAGKSGKIKIEIEVKNKESKEVNVNGKTRTIYTPFLVAGGVTLPNDKFSEVTVEGATMLSEGNNNIIAFTKIPGLKDSLQLDALPFSPDSEKLDKINDLTDGKITIEADAEEFSLGPIMITAASDASMLDDLDGAANLSEYTDMLNQVKDNYDKILAGGNKLNEGVSMGYSAAQNGLAMLSQPKFQEKMSLITNPENVRKSNKLLEDADFAVKMNTTGFDRLLAEVRNDLPLVETFKNNESELKNVKSKFKQVQAAVNDEKTVDKLKEIKGDMDAICNQYDKLGDSTKVFSNEAVNGLNTLISSIKAEDIQAAVSDIKTLTPLQQSLQKAIAETELTDEEMKGLDSVDKIKQAKKNKFLANINASVKSIKALKAVLAGLPKDFTLSGFGADVSKYGEAYLLLRLDLAAVAQANPGDPVGAIQEHLKPVNNMLDGLILQQKTEADKEKIIKLKSDLNTKYTQGLNMKSILEEKAQLEKYNAMFSGNTIPTLENAMTALSSLNVFIDMYDFLQKEDPNKALLDLLSKSETPLTAIKPLLTQLAGMKPEEKGKMLQLTKDLSSVASDLNNQKELVNQIRGLMNGIGLEKGDIDKLNNFSKTLEEAEAALGRIKQLNIGQLNASKIDEAGKLLGMQNDLKESQTILRILRESLQDNEVAKANSLINTLPTYTSQLDQLKNGSQQLADGLKEYNDRAISQLYDKGNNGLSVVDELSQAKDAIVQSSKDYGCFSGKDDNMKGSTKFIMKTKEIKYEAPEEDDSNEQTTENKGFWAWLKSLIGLD